MLQQHGSLPGSSPQRATPIGVALTTKIERGSREPATQTYDLELSVLEAVRGDAAAERVGAEELSSRSALPGHEFLLVRLKFGYSRRARGGTESDSYTLEAQQFAATTVDGDREYPTPDLVSQPQPALVGIPVALKGSREGWIVLEVEKADREPLLAFHRECVENKYAIRRPVWLKLFQTDPMRIDCSCADCL